MTNYNSPEQVAALERMVKASAIIWNAPCSLDGERTGKQHAFIAAKRRKAFWMEPHDGNRTLCSSRKGIINENEEFIPAEDIESEEMFEHLACKTCLKIYKKLITERETNV